MSEITIYRAIVQAVLKSIEQDPDFHLATCVADADPKILVQRMERAVETTLNEWHIGAPIDG